MEILDAAMLQVRHLEQIVAAAEERPCDDSPDPDAWFPPVPIATAEVATAAYTNAARALCEGCPVQAACLELALRYEGGDDLHDPQEPHGIWGGTTHLERERMLRARHGATTIRERAAAVSRVLRQAG